MTVTKEHLYVGTLLLKNLQLLQFNAHEIYESICNGKHKIDPLYVGVGIYPNAARLNHGCYSATIRYFCGKSIILRSSRLLQEDDVVAENYGPVFFKKTLLERQRYLAGRYWFKCCCEACSDNWPLMNELSYIRIRIRCCSENCTKYLNVQFHNDYNKVYFCEKCRTSHKFSPKYQNIIKRCILWYAYGITIMDKHCIPEATQILLTALKVFHHIACAPHRFTHLAELGLQYCLMNNRR